MNVLTAMPNVVKIMLQTTFRRRNTGYLAGTRSVRGQYYGGNAKEPTTSQGGDKVEATPNSWLEDPFSTHHSGQWVTLRVLTLTLTPPLMLVLLSVPSTYFVLRTSLLRARHPMALPFAPILSPVAQ